MRTILDNMTLGNIVTGADGNIVLLLCDPDGEATGNISHEIRLNTDGSSLFRRMVELEIIYRSKGLTTNQPTF